MTAFRYTARPITGGPVASGRLTGETEAEVRAALRRIGLQPLGITPANRPRSQLAARLPSLSHRLESHLRTRRRAQRADLLDSLAMMLDSGLPLTECVRALAVSARGRQASMLRRLIDDLERGLPLSDATAAAPSWFDTADTAMIRAGERSGELSSVLATLGDRHLQSADLAGKITAALCYPAIILIVGLGVTVFLSVRTLPELASILENAGVQPPPLTLGVMAAGSAIARGWWLAGLATLAATLLIPATARLASKRSPRLGSLTLRPPRTARDLLIARAFLTTAALLRCGVTLVEALRTTAPTLTGIGARHLRDHTLPRAADRIERGEPVTDALDCPAWFDPEVRRLIASADAAGELEPTLTKLGERLHRRAQRSVDRLSKLLEPCAIIALSTLIGIVVLSAVLPLIRLQEVL